MRKWTLWMALLAAILSMAGCSAGAENSDVWMYAVSVGKADAILVSAGGATCLIDAGYARSRGRILAAMERMDVERLDAVFVTHTDDDHVDGLEWLAQSGIEIGAWYASAMYTGVKSEDKHPAVQAAKLDGQTVNWLKAGDSVPLGDAVLEVLAPSVLNTEKDDNNSLVMMLRSDEGSILLAGDMEFEEEAVLLSSGASLDCDVLKVGNHADDDTGSEAFIRAASPRAAVISTDSVEKPETPDPRLVALLQSVGAEVAVTQECTGGILVRLNGGVPVVERVNLPVSQTGVAVEDVVAGEDVVTLVNRGAEAQDLTGWYMVSDRGGELYVFPDDTVLGPGARLTIGTNSTPESFDLLWDDKKVIHKSKTDTITLYDANGMPVSAMDNGY